MGGVIPIKVRSEQFFPFMGSALIGIIISIIGIIRVSKAWHSSNYLEASVIIFNLGFIFFILISSKVILVIDVKKKLIHEYTWILGLKFGTIKHYNRLEKIFINRVKLVMKNQYGPAVNYRNIDSDLVGNYCLFKSFLKIEDGTKIFFIADPSKTRLIKKLKRLNIELCVELYDNTSGTSELL